MALCPLAGSRARLTRAVVAVIVLLLSGRVASGAVVPVPGRLDPALAVLPAPWATRADPLDPKIGFAAIDEDRIAADLAVLASPALQGRDSPSAGLAAAAAHIAARLSEAGFAGLGAEGDFRLPFERTLPAPDEDGCALAAETADGALTFALGTDFVPVWKADGAARGRAVFLGFGIDDDGERYDDIPSDLDGAVAVVVEGEPRHRRKFDGPEVTEAADLYRKLDELAEAGASGVLVVRRPAAPPEETRSRRGRARSGGHHGETAEDGARGGPFGFRHTWATWAGERPPASRHAATIPALEITPAAAARLLGFDPLEAVAEVDRRGKAPRPRESGREVVLAARSETRAVPIHNVAGVLEGSDPELSREHVVIGAHYDHVGVDTRGRIGAGADDNASGVAALLAVAGAFGRQPPRRSIVAVAFAAEEDGLLGSKAFCAEPPVPLDDVVAMINLDMVGFGEAKEVVVLGTDPNPDLEKLLRRARSLQSTRVRRIVTGQGQELFQRSDHFPFHEKGVPALFFFEGLPIAKNRAYHTWNDTLAIVDPDKVARTARLVFNTMWLLATDDDRPPPPER